MPEADTVSDQLPFELSTFTSQSRVSALPQPLLLCFALTASLTTSAETTPAHTLCASINTLSR